VSIWRTSDGVSWSPAMTGGFGLPDTNPGVIGMTVFQGKLYAGTGWNGIGAAGQLWRTSDGSTWTQITGNGMGVNTGGMAAFTTFGNNLYAGTCADAPGVQIWRSATGDSGTWTQVVTGGLNTTDNNCVTSLKEFNGALYAAVENPATGAEIWRSTTGNTGSWTKVNNSGFGSADNDLVGGFAIYGSYLYVGTHNAVTGAQLWRSNNGTTWTSVMKNGFGDLNNDKLESLYVYNGALYAGLNNAATGLEVWRSTNGTTWTQANPDGFGSASNRSTLWSNTTTIFNNSLYMGVENSATGFRIWKKLPVFGDVPASYWASSFIERLYNAGITGGCTTSPLNYCPGNTVTRAQMAIFLLRAKYGANYTPPAATGTFADVPISNPAAPWIEQLAKDGITGGCGGGNYCPNNPVTRAQMAIFLLRAEHGKDYLPPAATGVFLDVPASDFTAAYIEQLANEGITGGCGGGNYCPAKAVTRDQMAIFLVRAFTLP
ncbi:MAG: S-layer homology domain-containing protein, partial [Syntrophothermus sp.]